MSDPCTSTNNIKVRIKQENSPDSGIQEAKSVIDQKVMDNSTTANDLYAPNSPSRAEFGQVGSSSQQVTIKVHQNPLDLDFPYDTRFTSHKNNKNQNTCPNKCPLDSSINPNNRNRNASSDPKCSFKMIQEATLFQKFLLLFIVFLVVGMVWLAGKHLATLGDVHKNGEHSEFDSSYSHESTTADYGRDGW